MASELRAVGTSIQDEPDLKVRASFKGAEIAKLGPLPRQPAGDFDIEIVSMNAIEGGVEVFARAWSADRQIGFGLDGSVDIERFRIFNPPILVPDGTQTLKELSKGEPVLVDNFKEDLEQAILSCLDHIIKVKKEKRDDKNIVPERIGNTTSTFYPSLDGRTTRGGTQETWAQLHDGAGTGSATTDNPNEDGMVESFDNGTTEWFSMNRNVYIFDTSALGDTDSISAATLSYYCVSKDAVGGGFASFATGVTGANGIASDTALANADYQAIETNNTTDFATRIVYASWTTSAYNDYALNASGISNISKTGNSRFSHRNGADIDDSPYAIPASGDVYNRINVSTSEQSGTTQDPKLVVEHTTPTDTGNFLAFF